MTTTLRAFLFVRDSKKQRNKSPIVFGKPSIKSNHLYTSNQIFQTNGQSKKKKDDPPTQEYGYKTVNPLGHPTE
jgi:hypothetical protein